MVKFDLIPDGSFSLIRQLVIERRGGELKQLAIQNKWVEGCGCSSPEVFLVHFEAYIVNNAEKLFK